jgi:hypothetical protein
MLDIRMNAIDRSLDNREVWAGIRRLFDLVRTPNGWKTRLHISDYPSVGEHPSLHLALAQGIEVTSNLIANLLLTDPSQSKGREERGVFLWHPASMEDTPFNGMHQYYLKASIGSPSWLYNETLGIITKLTGTRDWTVTKLRDTENRPHDEIRCATEEQAVAAAIRRAAPWVALSVIEVFEPHTESTAP